MEVAYGNFQNLRLFAIYSRSHLLRIVPPSIIHQAAAGYDALAEWVLSSIIAGVGVTVVGLLIPRKVVHDSSQSQTYLGHKALRHVHLPTYEAGLGITSSDSVKGVAYIGCHVLLLERVVAASARENLSSLLERLRERPMAPIFLKSSRLWPLKLKIFSWRMRWAILGQPFRRKRTIKGQEKGPH